MIVKVHYINSSKISHHKDGDAAIDLRASGEWAVNLDDEMKEIKSEKYEIMPGERILIKTGVKIEIPKGYWGNIRDRSGLALKHGLHVLAGVIDENYRGEIGVVMLNLGKKSYVIEKDERIAQMIISPYEKVELIEDEELTQTVRGDGAFGNSGKR